MTWDWVAYGTGLGSTNTGFESGFSDKVVLYNLQDANKSLKAGEYFAFIKWVKEWDHTTRNRLLIEPLQVFEFKQI